VALENDMNQRSQSSITSKEDCGPPSTLNLPENWIDEADSFYTTAPAASLGFAVLGCFGKISLNSVKHHWADESAGDHPTTGARPLRDYAGTMSLFVHTSRAALAVLIILIVRLL
jgi:hypothetical protein